MKSFNLMIVSALALTQAHAALAESRGGREGHGGTAQVCRDPANPEVILSAVLQDFFEARDVRKDKLVIPVDETPDSRVAQARKALDKASGYAWDLDDVLKRLRVLDAGLAFNSPRGTTVTGDSKAYVKKRGCEEEQAAIFTPEGEIQVDGPIWTKFSETDKAGLLVHEAVYAFVRGWNGPKGKAADVGSKESIYAGDSRWARKVTAMMFATRPFRQRADTQDYWLCYTNPQAKQKTLAVKEYEPKIAVQQPWMAFTLHDSGESEQSGWRKLAIELISWQGRPVVGLEGFTLPEYAMARNKHLGPTDNSQDVFTVHTSSDVDLGQDLEIRTLAGRHKPNFFEMYSPDLEGSAIIMCKPNGRAAQLIDPGKIDVTR
jgi:hypothetical protein